MADTQGEGASIFRQSAMSRIASADDLDKYIKVTNPSAWVVLAAAILLIAGLAIWAATAIIPTTVQVTGIIDGTEVTCWVDQDTKDKIEEGGAYVTVMDVAATVYSLDAIPWSESEVENVVNSDYLIDSMTLSDWSYQIVVTLPHALENVEAETKLVPVNLTVTETHPLDLVLGNR